VASPVSFLSFSFSCNGRSAKSAHWFAECQECAAAAVAVFSAAASGTPGVGWGGQHPCLLCNLGVGCEKEAGTSAPGEVGRR